MKNNLSNLLVILILPGLLLFPACSNDSSSEKPPTAIKGVLDLTGWDLDKDGPVNLAGEWEFYWRNTLNPKILEMETCRSELDSSICRGTGTTMWWTVRLFPGMDMQPIA